MPDVIEIQEADAPAQDLPGSIPGERRVAHVGRSAARRQKAVLQKRKQLDRETRRNSEGIVEGPLRPCTLVNFNPVELVMEMEGRRITVPAPGREERFQIKLPHKGRKYQGAYAIFSNPILYTAVTGHEADEQLATIDVPKTDVRYFSPHAIGCAFMEQYNSPHFKMMGGLLLFDQDVRALQPERLQRTGHRIWIPERFQIEDSPEWTYTLREALLEDELDRILQAQVDYANTVIQRAHSLWTTNNPEEQKMITDTDREWDRYAVAMGWVDTLAAWVTAKIDISTAAKALRKCEYCQSQALDPGAWFCHKCNAPYDAYAAFKAGKAVPELYLERLPEAQFDEVMSELAARRRRMVEIHGAPAAKAEAESPRAEKPLTGAAAAAKARKEEKDRAAAAAKAAEDGK